MKVVVVESGEYEQRSIDLVARNYDSAYAALKAQYPRPYRVVWERPDECTAVGKFEQVIGYSTAHTTTFDFTEYEVL